MALITRDFGLYSADLGGCSSRSATTPGECLGPIAIRVEKRGRAMRPIAVLLGVVLLVVAGCSGDDAPAATTTTAPATTQPAAESTTPFSSAEEVDATVVYQPGSCTYLGPAVIPRGTRATFEFDDGGHAVRLFVVGRVVDGTTREEIIEYSETYGGPNAGLLGTPYYGLGDAYYQRGAGLMVVEFRDDGDWTVECLTPPDLTNRRYLCGMIKVIDG